MNSGPWTIEVTTEVQEELYLRTRNALFTPIDRDYLQLTRHGEDVFPARYFLSGNGGDAVACAGFYLRPMALSGGDEITVAMACSIGSRPEFRRQGFGRVLWQFCEQGLGVQADAVVIYTSLNGPGFAFYRAMGYEVLFQPVRLEWQRGGPAATAAVRTVPFDTVAAALRTASSDLWRKSNLGYGGFIPGRPEALWRWGRSSFFYDERFTGATPQFTCLEGADGNLVGYAVWSGPLTKIGWKKNAVEIWEIGCSPEIPDRELGSLLAPAVNAAASAGSKLSFWNGSGHFLSSRLENLGFAGHLDGLVVLGKWLKSPDRKWAPAECWVYSAAEYI